MDDRRSAVNRLEAGADASLHQSGTAVRESRRVSIAKTDICTDCPPRGVLEPAQRADGRRHVWRTRGVGMGRWDGAADGSQEQRHSTTVEAGGRDAGRGADAEPPGAESASRFIAAAASEKRDSLVIYTPEVRTIALRTEAIPRGRATWHNPRTGDRTNAISTLSGSVTRFATPGEGDWILVMR